MNVSFHLNADFSGTGYTKEFGNLSYRMKQEHAD